MGMCPYLGQQVVSEAHMFRSKLRRGLVRLSNAIAALRGRPQRVSLHAVIQKEGEWYVGWVEELPGANTQGATIEEVRENLLEAVLLLIESNRDDARLASKGREVRRETLTVAV